MNMLNEINPFDILSGKVAQTEKGTFWFKEAGHNLKSNGHFIGSLHRDNDLPAIIWANGSQEWRRNGKAHRDNDLPSVIHSDGSQYWYVNGKLHRDNDLPAMIWADGSKFWRQSGQLHRENGPAVIFTDGESHWYIMGKEITEEEFDEYVKRNKPI